MLDINLIRQNPREVKEGIEKKNANPKLVDDFLLLDNEWRKLMKEVEELRAKQKKLGEERKIEEAVNVKEQIQILDSDLKVIEKKRQEILEEIPNLPSEDTPVGKDDSENEVLRKVGEPRKFDFKILDHVELGKKFGIIDTEQAGRISGARFSYLKGKLVLLEFALIQYALEVLTNEKTLKSIADKIKKGYNPKPFIPVLPPAMIRPDVFQKMARLKPEEERYHFTKDDIYLIGSAEHTLGPLHMDEIIPENKLPIRYVGFSTNFRREAGSYGKDTKGILRLHQFDKVEAESFTLPEDGVIEQGFLVAIQEYLMNSLGLPYQVVICSSGDQGDPDARHLDIETWLPSENKYRETHSADYMGDYQARRLNTRAKRSDGKIEFVHMNDATIFAQRPLIAIIENYQQKDGSIEIPKVLRKYLNFKKIN